MTKEGLDAGGGVMRGLEAKKLAVLGAALEADAKLLSEPNRVIPDV